MNIPGRQRVYSNDPSILILARWPNQHFKRSSQMRLFQFPHLLFTNSPGMEPFETSFSRSPGSTHVSWEITSNLVTGKPAHREKEKKDVCFP